MMGPQLFRMLLDWWRGEEMMEVSEGMVPERKGELRCSLGTAWLDVATRRAAGPGRFVEACDPLGLQSARSLSGKTW